MTIIIQRAALLPALAEAVKAVDRKNTIPIMSNVMIEGAEGILSVTGSDTDVEITTTAACSGGEKAFTLPANLFQDAVRKMPEGCEIGISNDGRTATIQAGRAKIRLPVLPASDYPRMSRGDMPASFCLAPSDLAAMLSTVSYAISTSMDRVYLQGIFWHANGNELVTVATDGHRLSRLTFPLPDGAADMPSIIVPHRTINVLKGFADGKEDVAIAVSETKIRFSALGMTLTSKLVDGHFPDYQRVIPTGNENHFTLDRAALKAAVDRVVTISASVKSSAVKFEFGHGVLKLSAKSQDSGDAEDEVTLDDEVGNPVMTGFNGKYCFDMLGASDAAKLTFMLGDAGSPAVILPVGDLATTFVMMPMRV